MADDGPLFTPEQQQELNGLKVELKIKNEKYLRSHPEVSIVLSTLTEAILEEKPVRENILPFIEDFFSESDLHEIVDKHNEKMAAQRTSEPLTAKGLTKHADSLMQQQEWEKAVQFYTKALKVAPNEPEVYYKRGFITHKHLKDYDAALKDYSKAIEAKPIHAEAYKYRADITQYINDNPAKAIQDYDMAIAFGLVNDADVFSCRGDAKRKTNDIMGAEEDILTGIQLGTNNGQCKYHYALLLHYVRQDYKKALEEYSMAIDLGVVHPQIYAHRGDAFLAVKDYENATKDITTCKNKASESNDKSIKVDQSAMEQLLTQIHNQHLAEEKTRATRQYSHLKQNFAELSFDGDLLKQESTQLLIELSEIVLKYKLVQLVITCVARQQEIADIRADSVQSTLAVYLPAEEDKPPRYKVVPQVGEKAAVTIQFQ